MAISIGLLVANVIQPGRWAEIDASRSATPEAAVTEAGVNPLTQFLDNIPRSVLGPLGDGGKVIGVIFLAVAIGVALRQVQHPRKHLAEDLLELGLAVLLVVLGWLVEIIPLAVFGIVARIVGENGFSDFLALGAFVIAVMAALLLQATYYLLRVRAGSWVKPRDLIRGCRDALVMAFSTASSTISMPVTFACLKDRVGLREESASLGALVGANFNNDGTALYEAMAALFISQMIGQQLGLADQLLVVVTSVVASVGAAGIPQAGLVTMTMVFTAVRLPTEYIPILLTVDWFLDRCRTAINVMGDMNISCLLDGKQPASEAQAPPTRCRWRPMPRNRVNAAYFRVAVVRVQEGGSLAGNDSSELSWTSSLRCRSFSSRAWSLLPPAGCCAASPGLRFSDAWRFRSLRLLVARDIVLASKV